jgi:hypothetical protein
MLRVRSRDASGFAGRIIGIRASRHKPCLLIFALHIVIPENGKIVIFQNLSDAF